jgi:hypothetical protein
MHSSNGPSPRDKGFVMAVGIFVAAVAAGLWAAFKDALK